MLNCVGSVHDYRCSVGNNHISSIPLTCVPMQMCRYHHIILELLFLCSMASYSYALHLWTIYMRNFLSLYMHSFRLVCKSCTEYVHHCRPEAITLYTQNYARAEVTAYPDILQDNEM